MTQQEFQNRYRYNPTTDELGKGGFGSVYKAYDNVDDRWVAIKIAKVERDRENISLMNEVRTAKKLPNHTNIARYENCYRFDFPVGTYDHAVIQYYEAGNLSQLIKNKQLSLAEKEAIAKGVIAGIAHLHQHNVVHRDIKSSNVLIAQRPDGTYNPKIADFGLSKQFTDTAKSYFSNSFAGGSLLYVAPEQLKGGQIRKNVDLWSMGVMLFELFTGQVPFYPAQDDGTETARKEIIQQIEKAALPNTINDIPTPWQTLIRKCLVVNSGERLKDTKAVFAIIGGRETIEDNTIIEDKIVEDKTIIEDKKSEDTKKPFPVWLYPLIGGVVIIGLLLFYFNKNNGSNGAVEPTLTDSVAVKIDTIIPEKDTKKDSEAEANKRAEEEKAQKAAEAQRIADAKAAEADRRASADPFASQMKYIRGGTFQMGSNDGESDEKPVHSVSVSSFSMSKYEVTQKQWTDIMGTNPSHFKGCDNCPVENVSWNDIQGFIRKLNGQTGKNYRLPTEAKWEYAARGGQNYKYAGSDNIGSVVWYNSNSGGKTHPVGQKSANGYGLYDMSGNVWEWCQDTWHSDYSGAPTNGRAWTSGGNSASRVLRGGSWNGDSGICRAVYRLSRTPSNRDFNFGFRLVLP
jgi:formylglycine-generating enzyme required for sulfatase activity